MICCFGLLLYHPVLAVCTMVSRPSHVRQAAIPSLVSFARGWSRQGVVVVGLLFSCESSSMTRVVIATIVW